MNVTPARSRLEGLKWVTLTLYNHEIPQAFDEMRKQGGLVYPESLETADASVAPS